MGELLANRVLLVALTAWLLAQTLKLLIYVWRERRLNLRYFASSGGMPSAHSALVTALATATAITAGPRSPLFAVAVIFAAIVMYDAAGVRQAVSVQARILNRMLDEIFVEQRFDEKRLRELIGHTPFEVFVGALLGLVVGLLLT
ncbi:MAG TPA: divergent PAP2 family protein [Chloroflexota bacterium]|nr:divergent PAP2 family protein [Chloroflexota bacterium]HZU04404.1 divergent PAP2 family protein [Chloroflexota bacterium]